MGNLLQFYRALILDREPLKEVPSVFLGIHAYFSSPLRKTFKMAYSINHLAQLFNKRQRDEKQAKPKTYSQDLSTKG